MWTTHWQSFNHAGLREPLCCPCVIKVELDKPMTFVMSCVFRVSGTTAILVLRLVLVRTWLQRMSLLVRLLHYISKPGVCPDVIPQLYINSSTFLCLSEHTECVITPRIATSPRRLCRTF